LKRKDYLKFAQKIEQKTIKTVMCKKNYSEKTRPVAICGPWPCHTRLPTCAIFSWRRSPCRPSPLWSVAYWRQHRSLLAIGLNPTVQRHYRWVKTTRTCQGGKP
jgi:hypothetical protein